MEHTDIISDYQPSIIQRVKGISVYSSPLSVSESESGRIARRILDKILSYPFPNKRKMERENLKRKKKNAGKECEDKMKTGCTWRMKPP